MATFQIKKGRNIRVKGEANQEIKDLALPKRVAVQPPDFKGLKPRLAVKVGDSVKCGTPLLTDKEIDGLKVLSPASGKVVDIKRGHKRALLEVVVETDKDQTAEQFTKLNDKDIVGLDKEKLTQHLMEGGIWPVIRQRPFAKIAHPNDSPKAIFIHAMNTEPLAANLDFILDKQEKEFQTGINVLTRFTKGKVHLCTAAGSKSKALTESKNCEIHEFSGPHPAGNVGTHIHHIDPIQKGDIVWYVEAQDVIRIASLLLEGTYPTERIVAVTGEGAKNRNYVRANVGASFSALLEGSDLAQARCLTGSILAGRDVGKDGFLGFYDSQITAFSDDVQREFLGWLLPGFKKYTFTKTFASAFLPEKEASLNSDENGGHRAIVLNNVYDDYNALDILTFFLLRAVIAGDIEEAERLGILECAHEDFALCTFACPSKTDVGGIIQEGLDLIEREG